VPVSHSSPEDVARQLVTALNESSPDAYLALYPSVEEFRLLMNENASIYGSGLIEAQDDFEFQFRSKVIPGTAQSFNRLLKEGEVKGIVWREVRFVKAELVEQIVNESNDRLRTSSLVVTISHQGTNYSILMEEALRLNGRWCASRSIRFV
jgi:hypothetical protein